MKRIRKNSDGSETTFVEKPYGPKQSYHAEIEVSLEELRILKREGKLIRVRMAQDTKSGRDNLVPWQQIEDFDWKS